jgi:hypothetical protein
MAKTYEPIFTTTIATSDVTTEVVFSSIPQTYTDLRIVANTITYPIQYKINNDSGANYDTEWLASSGLAAATSSDFGGSTVYCYYYAPLQDTNNPSLVISDILNYTNTSNHKTILSTNGAISSAGGSTGLTCSVWKNTNAVTQLNIKTATTYFTAGSVVTLFGIKAA